MCFFMLLTKELEQSKCGTIKNFDNSRPIIWLTKVNKQKVPQNNDFDLTKGIGKHKDLVTHKLVKNFYFVKEKANR